MKCIKAIKTTKDSEIGEIRRVDDKLANRMVGSVWTFVPKFEWKQMVRKVQEEEIKSNQEGEKVTRKKDKSRKKEK